MNPRNWLRRGRRPAMLVFAAVMSARPASTQVIDSGFSVTNGTVYATALSGNTLYVGGDFTQVGPATGGGVPIDEGTGLPTPFPKITGPVFDVVSDGAGGWYVGGRFTHVGGTPRPNLAHILANGSLSAWAPNVNGEVMTLAVSGGLVYLGGGFDSIDGQPRNSVGAIDATTGLVSPWNPNPSGFVGIYALAVSGGTVYLGGDFKLIGGQFRRSLAAVDATTGLPTAWSPHVGGPGEPRVLALAVAGSVVYASGAFDSIGGQLRKSIAAIDATTGLVTSWNANASGPAGIYALAVSGGTVYAGGSFSNLGGQTRSNIAALDAASGLATDWNPYASGLVSALAVSGGTVYAGGYFTAIGGRARNLIAALDAATGLATDWDPNANGPPGFAAVYSLAAGGGRVYAAGSFVSLGQQVIRSHIAAIDVTTGLATPWNPSANRTVRALLVSGGTVYAGGDFTQIGGQLRGSLAALDATTGLATGWNPWTTGSVKALAASGGTMYVGGEFTAIGGTPRNSIAAIDAATGAVSGWNPNAVIDQYGGVKALAVSGGTVYVGGGFSSIGGQARNNIAAIDATSGLATAWNPDAIYDVSALVVSGDIVYAGGSFYIIGGEFRSRIAALDINTGLATDWDPGVGGSSYPNVHALLVSDGTVYAGGAFGSAGGRARSCVAAIDATTGLATPWNPDAENIVLALAVGGGKVYAGGQFTTMGGQPSGGLAAMEDSPTTPVLLARFDAQAIDEGIRLRWQFGQPELVVDVALERADNLHGPWLSLSLDPIRTADFEEVVDRTVTSGTTYYYRLIADLSDGSYATFGPISAGSIGNIGFHGLTGIAPNPASGNARIDYALVREEQVRISVVDVAGREAELLLDETTEPGSYSLIWDGRRGSTRLPAGVYFVRWESPGRMMQRRLVLMR